MITSCERERTELKKTPAEQQPDDASDKSLDSSLRSLLRRKLWSAVVATLNNSKLSYCLLGAPEDISQADDSDMDFVVRPCDYRDIPQLLASAAASVGARLVQAIEHETTATYFAISGQEPGVVDFLHPDCTTDYRRQGRLWISSEELLRGRQRSRAGYFRPAPDIDFKYYLTKQVLKQTLSNRQWTKLAALYQAANHPQQALAWWEPGIAAQIEQSLLHNNRDGFRDLLPHLGRELNHAPGPQSPIRRASSFARDAARVIARIAHPTGLLVQITGGHAEQRTELARSLTRAIAPAFRRSCILDSRNVVKIAGALVKSTLVVSTGSFMPVSRFFTGVDIRWQPELSPGQNLERAIAAVLSHLSLRTMRRLNLQSPSPPPIEAGNLATPTSPLMSRILLSAYACEPDKGSEPAVGWMWATELGAAGHEVWVLTREANRRSIEASMPSPNQDRLHFEYCDLPRWARGWKRLSGAIYLYYFLWQWLAFRTARRLHRDYQFDRVHHVSFVSLRAPSFMGWLGIPFYFGPVSGGECVPRLLRRNMTQPARALEFVRDTANLLSRFDPLMRTAFRQATRIYVTSRDSLNLIPRKYHDKCEVHLAIGLTLQQLCFSRRKLALGHRELRCVYAGRLLEWKGLHLALLATQRLQAQGVPVHLTIVGDGPAKASLQALADQLGIASRITWHSWLPREEVQSKLSEHDVFVFPSLRDSGGMAVLEALAHGLPVICTALGGPASIVNNRCGRVVAAENRSANMIADDLAEHLRELAQNPGLRRSLSIEARRRAWEFEFRRLVRAVYGAPSNAHAVSENVPA